ncbi:MAG: DUF1015 family protein [Candidatus Euphemobacter frigidus]|nr:DUF1015 family protein [Candidatus Euphemobacter frigidus]MDP8276461.1 DUF1015 family protein [Candidatus Euphemobacter frigidus]
MVKIKEFRGLRPTADMVEEVASPPYDVLNSAEARARVKGKPYSFLHVVKPEIDLPEDTALYDEVVYRKGKENLDKFISDKVLIQDPRPAFYFYRLIMGDTNQTGLVAGASIDDYANNVIKKHERTRVDKKADRIKHVDTLNANTGPVFLTYRARGEMDALTDEAVQTKPLYDFTAEDGIRHTLWKVDDLKTVAKIREIFSGIDYLYVADGHHRSASGTKVGQQRRAENSSHTGEEEYNYFLSVIFPHDQLRIMDYNRVVRDLNGLSRGDFLSLVSQKFEIAPAPVGSPYRPETPHNFGMYLDGQWYRLTAKAGSFPEDNPVGSLDASILQENLLSPILGIGDPRKDNRIDFVGGIRGLDELVRKVDGGEAVAFSLYPTSIGQLMDVADRGLVMPPKSTWFEPKLRSGIIVHLLD